LKGLYHMTNAEITARALSTAAGISRTEARRIVKYAMQLFDAEGKPHNFRKHRSKSEARDLLKQFKQEGPGIRAWLLRGALL